MSVQSRACDARCPRRSSPSSAFLAASTLGPTLVLGSSVGTASGDARPVGAASATVERSQVEVAAPPVQLGQVAGEQPEVRGHTEPDCPLPELDRVEQVQWEHLSQHRRRRMSQQRLRGGVVERDAPMQVGAHECRGSGSPHDLAEQARGAQRGRDVDPAEDDAASSGAVVLREGNGPQHPAPVPGATDHGGLEAERGAVRAGDGCSHRALVILLEQGLPRPAQQLLLRVAAQRLDRGVDVQHVAGRKVSDDDQAGHGVEYGRRGDRRAT